MYVILGRQIHISNDTKLFTEQNTSDGIGTTCDKDIEVPEGNTGYIIRDGLKLGVRVEVVDR